MGHEREVKQLIETVNIYSENPGMRHQLTSLAELLIKGGTPEEKLLAEEIAEERNLSIEDFDRIPAFWTEANLKRLD